MRRHSEVKDRQNDEEALTLLRASEHCLNRERYIKYLIIFMSFSVCLAAIFNRYLPQMLPGTENIVEIQGKIATYLNLISGVVLVCGIALGFYVSRMHAEGTTLRDRYEAYTFNNAPNHTILRPIPQTIVEIYAKKTNRKRDEKFLNAIYGPDDSPSTATAQFEYIKREVLFNYKLYIYIQPFFLTIWIGFCIIVMIIAVSFNDRFVTTLINILIPSISAISIIANSWRGCILQIKQLQTLQNAIDEIQAMSENKKMLYITDNQNMRLLADGLFEYRASPFMIPKFLIRRFQKSIKSGYQNVGRHTAETEEAVEQTKRDTANFKSNPGPKNAERTPGVHNADSVKKTITKKAPSEKADEAEREKQTGSKENSTPKHKST